MKKILLGLIATVSLAFSANAQDIRNTKSIELGINKVSNYAGGCTAGKAFCASRSTVTLEDNTAYAGINKTAEGRIIIQMNELYHRSIESSLSNGGIVVDKDFTLSKALLDSIGIPSEYWVKPGNYQPSVTNGIYTFTF